MENETTNAIEAAAIEAIEPDETEGEIRSRLSALMADMKEQIAEAAANTNTNTNISAIEHAVKHGYIMQCDVIFAVKSTNEIDYLRYAVLGDAEEAFTAKGLIAAGGRLARAEMAVQIGRAVRAHLVNCGAASLKDENGAALGLRVNGTWEPISTAAAYAKVLAKVGALANQPHKFEQIEESCAPEKGGKRAAAPRATKSVELE